MQIPQKTFFVFSMRQLFIFWLLCCLPVAAQVKRGKDYKQTALTSVAEDGFKFRVSLKNVSNGYPFADRTKSDLVFIKTDGDEIAAVDGLRGKVLWRYSARPQLFVNEIQADKTRVLIGESVHSDGLRKNFRPSLTMLDAQTGKILWQRELDVPDASSFILRGNKIYLNVADEGIKILEAATGKDSAPTAWLRQCGAYNYLTSVDVDNNLYLNCDGKLMALDPRRSANAPPLWTSGKRGRFDALQPEGDKTLFYINRDAFNRKLLRKLDRVTGQTLWEQAVEGYDSGLSVAGNTLITNRDSAGSLKAHDLDNGNVKWTYPEQGKELARWNEDKSLVWQNQKDVELSFFEPAIKSVSARNNSQSLDKSPAIIYTGDNVGRAVAFDAATGKLRWRFPISEERLDPPTVLGNTAYYHVSRRNEEYLIGLDLKTGEPRWEIRLYGLKIGRIKQVNDNSLAILTADGSLNILDHAFAEQAALAKKIRTTKKFDSVLAATSLQTAKIKLGAPAEIAQVKGGEPGSGSGSGGIGSGRSSREKLDFAPKAVLIDKTIYLNLANAEESHVYRVDAKTGVANLFVRVPKAELTTLVKAGNRLFFNASYENKVGTGAQFKNILYVVEAETAKTLFTAETQGRVAQPPQVAGDYVGFAATDGTVSIIDVQKSESVKASAPIADRQAGSPFVLTAKAFYVMQLGLALKKFDASSGAQLWETSLDTSGIRRITSDAERLYVGSANGALHCLNPTDGSIIWKYDTEGKPLSAQATLHAVDNKVFYVTSADYRSLVQVFEASSGKLLWQRAISHDSGTISGKNVLASVGGDKFWSLSSGEKIWSRNNFDVVPSAEVIGMTDESNAIFFDKPSKYLDSSSTIQKNGQLLSLKIAKDSQINWQLNFEDLEKLTRLNEKLSF